MMPNVLAPPIEYAYLITGVLFIVGLRLLGSPKTARLGNRVAAVGMLISLVAVLLSSGFVSWPILIIGLVLGAAVGIAGARQVKMTAMPQMVAIFNGAGGGAAAMVAAAEFLSHIEARAVAPDVSITIILSAVVGAMSFTGSIIAYLKLQELMTGRPIVYPGQQIVNAALAIVMVGSAIFSVYSCSIHTDAFNLLHPGSMGFLHQPPPGVNYELAGESAATYQAFGPALIAFFISMAAAAALGVLVVLPIGGADMPVIISLLNSFTGLAAATTGFVLSNNVLIISGALVGASGTLLTLMMGKAMNRSVTNVLFGAFGAAPTGGSSSSTQSSGGSVREASVDDVATMLAYANQVVIVPGYGMAVAQAQHSVRELADQLESRGVIVKYAIHPVAGRMPGHMNVLLAEANVPYPSLFDMEDINPDFSRTDVALVIGANDVTNPAARYDKASPIYGMPILDVDKAERVVVLKRSMKPGFAGIDNALYEDPRCVMLFGDAKKSVDQLALTIKKV